MPKHAGMSQRRAWPTSWASSFTTGLAMTLFALPVHAQGLAGAQSISWVNTTIASVTAVFVLWAAATGVFSMARRLRWVSPHRHSRLTRGLQVVCGGLLLMAVFMPYLAMHHPVVAVGLMITAGLMALVFGARQPHGSRS